MNLQIGITDLCNLECIMCLQTAHNGLYGKKENKIERLHKDNRGFISENTFKKILQDTSDIEFELLKMQWLGESFIHPGFKELLRILRKYENIKRIVFTTNISKINDDIITEIKKLRSKIHFIFSLDSFDPVVYKKIKGRDLLPNVLNNINRVLSHLPDAIYTFQMILMEENKNDVDRFIKKIKNEHKIKNIFFNESSIYKEENSNILIKRLGAFDQEKFDKLHLKEFLRLTGKTKEEYQKIMHIQKISDKTICPAPFRTPTVNWDGTIAPCCMDSFLEMPMGNINKDSFSNIWRGEEYRKLREAHLNHDLKAFPRCLRCSGLPDLALNKQEIEDVR
ncbi:MAG: hypothetical protein C0601_12080 [Candidatus Muiribacterium halophilum]|uniref:Radical SAM core domain-containing protein n=1 Tax=Muiribacterium halophilum TaxID=2053465 RepID=A0A2N5ZAX9_MUIH1|nr:MAG: hypothetical protein C0601_12080 [Candidatus Muirbacterium halophilum]